MALRVKRQRPTPLQQRYYRAGLNEGSARAAKVAEEALHDALEAFRLRLLCRGVDVPTPRISPTHPMTAVKAKGRR